MTAILVLLGLWAAAIFFRSGKPLWNLFLSAAGGGAAFWVSAAVSSVTGVSLPLNLATALTGLFLGAPGIASLWLLQLVWK